MPARRFGLRWAIELSTADPGGNGTLYAPREDVTVEGRSMLLLRRDF